MNSASVQTNGVNQEDVRDQLKVMIQQQGKFYQCQDYLHINDIKPEVHNPLHVVAQCAMVVTDIPAQAPESPTEATQRCFNEATRSPIMVTRFPHSSMEDAQSRGIQENASGGATIGTSFPSPFFPTEAACLAEWRRQMIEWAFSVANTYSLDREVVAVSLHLLDRYIASELLREAGSAEAPIDREDFQLFAMVCLCIAIKAFVPYRKLTVSCIIEMSNGFYNEQHITEAEIEILEALGWHVNQPTVMDFCRLYLDLFPQTTLDADMVYASCQYLSERVLEDVFFIAKPTSLVALANVLLATQRFGACSRDVQCFLANLQDLISVEPSEFDAVFRRLEGLC